MRADGCHCTGMHHGGPSKRGITRIFHVSRGCPVPIIRAQSPLKPPQLTASGHRMNLLKAASTVSLLTLYASPRLRPGARAADRRELRRQRLHPTPTTSRSASPTCCAACSPKARSRAGLRAAAGQHADRRRRRGHPQADRRRGHRARLDPAGDLRDRRRGRAGARVGDGVGPGKVRLGRADDARDVSLQRLHVDGRAVGRHPQHLGPLLHPGGHADPAQRGGDHRGARAHAHVRGARPAGRLHAGHRRDAGRHPAGGHPDPGAEGAGADAAHQVLLERHRRRRGTHPGVRTGAHAGCRRRCWGCRWRRCRCWSTRSWPRTWPRARCPTSRTPTG